MTFRLVDKDWELEFSDALRENSGELRIVCPFIKAPTLAGILPQWPGSVRVITRFNLADFANGVSDIAALRSLLDAGMAVRGVRGLHAKLYIFGTTRAIVTSANLTEAGLRRNHEFGMVTRDAAAIEPCIAYFDDLWQRSGSDLRYDRLEEWTRTVDRHLASGGRSGGASGLDDHGSDAGIVEPPRTGAAPLFADAPQAFVKFLGEGSNRVPVTWLALDEVKGAGCHWALAYPAAGGRRPTGVQDGAVMFISRLVKGPDIRVFGRAIALKHEQGRDEATLADIERRPWKSRWPLYIRVHHAEFVAGTMKNGVPLSELMGALGTNSFASTQRNAARGHGNTDPRRAFMQQPSVKLSNEGFHWLSERLGQAFDVHGRIPHHDLDQLDWPELPDRPDPTPEFRQEAFDRELRRMLEAEKRTGKTSSRVIARDLHRSVVGGAQPYRMRMACRAMWKLWKLQGSIRENVVHTTKSGESSTVEIEFLL